MQSNQDSVYTTPTPRAPSIPKLHIFSFRAAKLQFSDWASPHTLKKVQKLLKYTENPSLLVCKPTLCLQSKSQLARVFFQSPYFLLKLQFIFSKLIHINLACFYVFKNFSLVLTKAESCFLIRFTKPFQLQFVFELWLPIVFFDYLCYLILISVLQALRVS